MRATVFAPPAARSLRAGLAIAVVAAAILLAGPRPSSGAEPADPVPIWQVGPYIGGAVRSPGGEHWGSTPDRDHLVIGIRGVAPVLRWRRFTLATAAELIPVFVVTNNPKSRTVVMDRFGEPVRVEVESGRGPVAGFGVVPFGLEAEALVQPHWRAFAAGGIGLVQFTRAVPVIDSRPFNYTLEWGGGVLWEPRPRRRLRLGYKFHHLSNNWSAEQNPGLDANLFYVGFERPIGRL